MIVIWLLTRSDTPPRILSTAYFSEQGGTIGRDPACTLVLADPERRISRQHFEVRWRDGQYRLHLLSDRVPVLLDDRPMVPRADHPIAIGSRIAIGPYLLQVRRAQAEDEIESFKLPQAPNRPSVFSELLPTTPGELDLVVGDPTGANARPLASAAGGGLDALYAALRMPPPPAGAREATLAAERIGLMLRAFVGGALSLLETRAASNVDLGLLSVQSARRRPNPLKQATDLRMALALLLAPTPRGTLDPVDAVNALFEEWQTHEQAMRDGMRAALAAALDRLDPQTLELRLTEGGLLDHVLPANRKARLWERYVERHTELMREAQHEFDAALAGAFIKAFEDRLARSAAADGEAR